MQIHIENMTCGGCVKAVENVVAMLDPAAKVAANVDERIVDVETSASIDTVVQHLTDAGWDARPAG